MILFFTRAVNELTSPGALGVTLGFFFARDLYPKTTAPGPCAGSNFAEMFYLLVPDTGGVVNQNKRSKSLVLTLTNGTVAHEYQHLINASRRMYVNGVGPAFEEPWLDEGLAHVAEELNFFRSANRSPRTNLDATGFNDPIFTNAYSVFAINNFRRYSLYLGTTETQSPIGFNSFDDDLQTRGAIWNFLRYAADHLPAGAENTFWFNLVNSTYERHGEPHQRAWARHPRRCFTTGRCRSFWMTMRRTSIPDINNPPGTFGASSPGAGCPRRSRC